MAARNSPIILYISIYSRVTSNSFILLKTCKKHHESLPVNYGNSSDINNLSASLSLEIYRIVPLDNGIKSTIKPPIIARNHNLSLFNGRLINQITPLKLDQ